MGLVKVSPATPSLAFPPCALLPAPVGSCEEEVFWWETLRGGHWISFGDMGRSDRKRSPLLLFFRGTAHRLIILLGAGKEAAYDSDVAQGRKMVIGTLYLLRGRVPVGALRLAVLSSGFQSGESWPFPSSLAGWLGCLCCRAGTWLFLGGPLGSNIPVRWHHPVGSDW